MQFRGTLICSGTDFRKNILNRLRNLDRKIRPDHITKSVRRFFCLLHGITELINALCTVIGCLLCFLKICGIPVDRRSRLDHLCFCRVQFRLPFLDFVSGFVILFIAFANPGFQLCYNTFLFFCLIRGLAVNLLYILQFLLFLVKLLQCFFQRLSEAFPLSFRIFQCRLCRF